MNEKHASTKNLLKPAFSASKAVGKFFFSFCVLVAFSGSYSWVYAQVPGIRHDVCASGGTSMESKKMSLYWTVGETFVSNHQQPRGDLYEGFQQSVLYMMVGMDGGGSKFISRPMGKNIYHYPNPVRTRLMIEDPHQQVQRIMIYTVEGYFFYEIERNNTERLFIVDMQAYPSGTYFFNLHDAQGKALDQFRVIKIR